MRHIRGAAKARIFDSVGASEDVLDGPFDHLRSIQARPDISIPLPRGYAFFGAHACNLATGDETSALGTMNERRQDQRADAGLVPSFLGSLLKKAFIVVSH